MEFVPYSIFTKPSGHSPTHSLTLSSTQLLSLSSNRSPASSTTPTQDHSLVHLFVHSLTHSPTPPPNHPLAQLTHSVTHSFTYLPTPSPNHPLAHSLTQNQPTQSLTHSSTHSFTQHSAFFPMGFSWWAFFIGVFSVHRLLHSRHHAIAYHFGFNVA